MKLSYVKGIETIRCVGVVLVVIYHLFTNVLPGGFFGVDIFFVISGFLVTSLFVKEQRETDRINIIGFYVRRVRRLLPAAAFMVVCTLSLSLLISPDLRVGIRAQTSAVFGWITNYFEIMTGGSYENQFIPHLFVHTWTLGVEMHYYIIWGVIFAIVSAICVRASKRIEYENYMDPDNARALPPEKRILFFICIGIAAYSYARMQFGMIGLQDPSPVYYATSSRIFPLMIGSALGLVTGMQAPRKRLPVFVALPGLILLLLGLVFMAREFSFSDPRTYSYGILLASLLTVAAIGCVMSLQLKKFFNDVPFMAAIGKRSYSIYLFHWPLYNIFRQFGINGTGPFPNDTPQPVYAALALVATALLAEVSYRVFEMRKPRPRVEAIPAAAHTDAEIYAAIGRASGAVVGMSRGAEQAPPIEAPATRAQRSAAGGRGRLVKVTIVAMCVCALISAYALVTEPGKTDVEEGYLHQQVLINISNMTQYNSYLAGLKMNPVALHGKSAQLPPSPSELAAANNIENDEQTTHDNAENAFNQDEPAGPIKPIQAPGGADVTLFGDSVPLGAADVIQQTLGSVTIDAVVSRNLNAAVQLIQDYDSRGELGEYIVIALFTNPLPNFISLTNETMAAIPPGHRVIVVTPFGKDYMEPTADYVRKLPQYYDYVTVADWNAAIRDHKELLAADGLHMRGNDSMQIYANLLAQAIEQASKKPAKQ